VSNPFIGIAPLKGTNLYSASSISAFNVNRPFPQFGDITQAGVNLGHMWYNGLQVSARKRMSSGLEFIASYTLSRTLTDNLGYYGSGGVASEGAYWQNAYNRHGDWGRAFFDALHNFSLGGTYTMPFGVGRRIGSGWNRATDFVLGGWNVNFFANMHSGFPVTIISQNVSNQLVRGSSRANRYGDLNYSDQSIDHWFGTGNNLCLTPGQNSGGCAYGVPAPGQFGSAQKGTEEAPAFYNLDFSAGKQFHVTEQKYFDFRAELFNILNHPNFGPPGRNISSPGAFGVITSTVGTPRNLQFALKFYF